MLKHKETCLYLPFNADKRWAYDEYYIGERDKEKRRNGHGENHWSGAESLEWYNGQLLRDTMHGTGEYRWRHQDGEGLNYTYEGRFYCNRMHGYGTMSFPEGRTFTGLFHSNIRWGPGIMSHARVREDVGLWRGTQLIRLAWKPSTPSIAPDLNINPAGRAFVEPHRFLLATSHKTIGETNSALELLKQLGCDPLYASERWNRLYPKNCTDLSSSLCHNELFERDYYQGKINLLKEIASLPEPLEDSKENELDTTAYFAWNNNKVMIHMMQHCFTHDDQRNPSVINLAKVLTGPRRRFKQAGQHETDCRTLLMASYLGHTTNVAVLVNESQTHPDVADSLGNSAVMYATCGDKTEIIKFLVDAGGNVDSFNDSCCTPLGVALMRYACKQRDILPSGYTQALIPPPITPAPPPVPPRVLEWNFSPEQTPVATGNNLPKSPSKISKNIPFKKSKSVSGFKDTEVSKKKTDQSILKTPAMGYSDISFTEDKRVYGNINTEFSIRVNDMFSQPSGISPVPYLFEVNDMVKEIDAAEDELKKVPEKGAKNVAPKDKVVKDTRKPSKEIMWQNSDKDEHGSLDSFEKLKLESLSRIVGTILNLLENGANPKLVKAPKPALVITIAAGSPELVKHLVDYGADINEIYPEMFGYTPLDLAVSKRFSYNSLEVIRAALECRASTNHRLLYVSQPADPTQPTLPPELGPTLLHAVLARKTESEIEDEIRKSILELLLEHKCDPIAQFKGRSAVEVASSKSMAMLDTFIRNPTTNLNAIINNNNQTILVKLFSVPFFKTVVPIERLQMFTNLLLFGADPLLECQNGEDKFENIFVFSKKVLFDLVNSKQVPTSPAKSDTNKKAEKTKKEPAKVEKSKKDSKPANKTAVDDIGDYKQAIDLVTECARMLHIRWLQAKLMIELVEVIDKYKHRPWNMILKEHTRKKSTALWLTPQRCLEIWDIMKTTKKKNYKDDRVLKHLLHIVLFYNKQTKITSKMQPTGDEKRLIENIIGCLLKEPILTPTVSSGMVSWNRQYVTPELTSKATEKKFNVCFECSLPFYEEKILCKLCKSVSFCSMGCLKVNVDRANCHPCSDYIKDKFFPTPSLGSSEGLAVSDIKLK